jgi:hypothetical protein
MIELKPNHGTNAKRPVSRARHEQRRDSGMFPKVTGNSQPDSMRTGACGSRTGFWTADSRAHLVELADVDLDDAMNVRPVSESDLEVINCTRIRISFIYLIYLIYSDMCRINGNPTR